MIEPYKVVPRCPTPEMIKAGSYTVIGTEARSAIWTAMLEAAPEGKSNKFESVKELLDQTSGGLQGLVENSDMGMEELFDTGSLTICVEGKPYVVSLRIEEAQDDRYKAQSR